MSLNHETTHSTMIGSAGVTAGSGVSVWLSNNASLITLAFVGIATLVTLFSFVLNYRLNLRDEARKIELHNQRMRGMPDKIEGTDDGQAPKDYAVD